MECYNLSIKEDDNFFKVLFDNIDTIIFSLNEKNEILSINKAFTKILNLSKEDVFLKRYYDFFSCINFKNKIYCERYCNKCRIPNFDNKDLVFVYENKSSKKKHFFTFQNKGISSKGNKINFIILNEISSLFEKNKKLENLCSIDDLTGLYNRRFILKRLEYEINLSNIYKESLSLIILDIDNFKEINDKFGHLVGDKVLIQGAELIKKSLRSSDYVGRIGGEEFIVILPKTGIEQAYVYAEKIRKNIYEYNYESYCKKVSISGGLASYKAEQSLEDFINKTDKLLYKAKNSGKNRILL